VKWKKEKRRKKQSMRINLKPSSFHVFTMREKRKEGKKNGSGKGEEKRRAKKKSIVFFQKGNLLFLVLID